MSRTTLTVTNLTGKIMQGWASMARHWRLRLSSTNAALRFDAARCHSRHGAPPPFQIKFQRNNRTESICNENIQDHAYECVVGMNCA